MDYPDGVYLLIRKEYSSSPTKTRNATRFICYVRDGHRSGGIALDRPIKEIYVGHWPYMSMAESANNYQHIYIGTEDFVSGMCLINPSMTSKGLLQVLGINYEFEE